MYPAINYVNYLNITKIIVFINKCIYINVTINSKKEVFLKKILALILVASVVLPAFAEGKGASITPYGMAAFRFRLRAQSTTPDGGDKIKALNYYNQLGYYLGVKTKLCDDQVSVVLQIGNSFLASQSSEFSMLHKWKNDDSNSLFPYFSLAYAKWDPGFLNISAGIIPVKAHGALNLVGVSLSGDARNYTSIPQASWGVRTDGSLAGFQFGVPFLKDDFKLGLELFATVHKIREQAKAEEPTSNPPAIMGVVNLPLGVPAFMFTPQFVIIAYRGYDVTAGKGDHEIGVGFDINSKASDNVSLRANFAYAQLPGENSKHVDKPDTYDSLTDIGILVSAGTSIKAGPGVIKADFKLNMGKTDKDTDETKVIAILIDLKYGINIKKNFIIMPRVRLFPTTYDSYKTFETRPELFFIGKF